jgi:hypothetical protein
MLNLANLFMNRKIPTIGFGGLFFKPLQYNSYGSGYMHGGALEDVLKLEQQINENPKQSTKKVETLNNLDIMKKIHDDIYNDDELLEIFNKNTTEDLLIQDGITNRTITRNVVDKIQQEIEKRKDYRKKAEEYGKLIKDIKRPTKVMSKTEQRESMQTIIDEKNKKYKEKLKDLEKKHQLIPYRQRPPEYRHFYKKYTMSTLPVAQHKKEKIDVIMEDLEKDQSLGIAVNYSSKISNNINTEFETDVPLPFQREMTKYNENLKNKFDDLSQLITGKQMKQLLLNEKKSLGASYKTGDDAENYIFRTTDSKKFTVGKDDSNAIVDGKNEISKYILEVKNYGFSIQSLIDKHILELKNYFINRFRELEDLRDVFYDNIISNEDYKNELIIEQLKNLSEIFGYDMFKHKIEKGKIIWNIDLFTSKINIDLVENIFNNLKINFYLDFDYSGIPMGINKFNTNYNYNEEGSNSIDVFDHLRENQQNKFDVKMNFKTGKFTVKSRDNTNLKITNYDMRYYVFTSQTILLFNLSKFYRDSKKIDGSLFNLFNSPINAFKAGTSWYEGSKSSKLDSLIIPLEYFELSGLIKKPEPIPSKRIFELLQKSGMRYKYTKDEYKKMIEGYTSGQIQTLKDFEKIFKKPKITKTKLTSDYYIDFDDNKFIVKKK